MNEYDHRLRDHDTDFVCGHLPELNSAVTIDLTYYRQYSDYDNVIAATAQ